MPPPLGVIRLPPLLKPSEMAASTAPAIANPEF
jgi:hypothetical protein